jgi:hypothetical protein
MLPICIVPMPNDKLTQYIGYQLIYKNDEYKRLYKTISKCIDSDCWAVSVNEEILFNKYNEDLCPIKESIMNNIIRQSISSNPHGNLLVQLFRYKKNATIHIYMHKNNSIIIQLVYNSENGEFNVSGFMLE